MPLSIGDLGKAIRNARVVRNSNDGFQPTVFDGIRLRASDFGHRNSLPSCESLRSPPLNWSPQGDS